MGHTREKRSLEVRALYCIKLGQLKFALLAAADRKEPSEVQRLNLKIPEPISLLNITKFFADSSRPLWSRGKSAASRSEGREVDARAGTANLFFLSIIMCHGNLHNGIKTEIDACRVCG